MDYEEEQQGELEALESIYEGEVTVLSAEKPRAFTIPVRSEKLNEEEDEDGLYVLLRFTHTDRYPEEAPEVEAEEAGENVTGEVLEEFMAFINEQVLRTT